ncbi:MAG: RluA family pseudouridine synthase [Betaproteobacteria bacterium]|nr:RluA family pseudouridine synthase [Betaproteobacteria bacterium]
MNTSKHERAESRKEEAVDYIDQEESDLSSLEQSSAEVREITVSSTLDGARLDRVLAEVFPDLSRTHLQGWINEGHIQLDQRPALKPSQSVRAGQVLLIAVPQAPQTESWQAEPMNLNIVFEDAELVVINKPAGLVVHPAAGHPRGTLANGLIGHAPEMTRVPRAGIVHRLDRDTSGLLVAAKTLPAQVALVRQLQARQVHRTYWALAWGCPRLGVISTWFGRDPRDRQKMAVLPDGKGKEAITKVESTQAGLLFGQPVSLVRLNLETGRTHQIRVHLEHLGCPIVGDPTYTRRAPHANRLLGGKERITGLILGQALHAQSLEFMHPTQGKPMHFSCPPPEGLQKLLSLAGLGLNKPE